jgi:hypothetical protein
MPSAHRLFALFGTGMLCFARLPTTEMTVKLSEYGYRVTLPNQIRLFFLYPIDGQVALTGSHIAVSFPVENRAPELARRGDVPHGSWVFRTVFINSSTGSADAVHDWWTAAPDSRFVALPDGHSLVSGGGHLRAYDANWREIWRLEIPASNVSPGRPYRSILVSPSGKTIGVVLDVDPRTEFVQLVDTVRWEQRATILIHAEFFPNWSLSDHEIAYATYRNGHTEVHRVSFDGEDDIVSTCQGYGAHFWFVSVGDLAIETDPGVLTLVGKLGSYLKRSFGGESIDNLIPASEGKRILMRQDKWSHGSGWLDRLPEVISTRLVVLNSETLTVQYSIQLDAKHHPIRGYDISANGHYVAYLDGETLHFRDIP